MACDGTCSLGISFYWRDKIIGWEYGTTKPPQYGKKYGLEYWYFIYLFFFCKLVIFVVIINILLCNPI